MDSEEYKQKYEEILQKYEESQKSLSNCEGKKAEYKKKGEECDDCKESLQKVIISHEDSVIKIKGQLKDANTEIQRLQERLELYEPKIIPPPKKISEIIPEQQQIIKPEEEIVEPKNLTPEVEQALISLGELIKHNLKDEEDIQDYIPEDPKNVKILLNNLMDGVLLCKLINFAKPDTINENFIATKDLNQYKKIENLNNALQSAKTVEGLTVIDNLLNIEAFLSQDAPKVVDFLKDIFKVVQKNQSVFEDQNVTVLKKKEENEQDFLETANDDILLRWINYHCKNGGYKNEVKNFGSDLASGEAYTILMNQLSPKLCDKSPLEKEGDLRSAKIIENGINLGCPPVIQASQITQGEPTFNLLYVAHLYECIRGLEPKNATIKDEDLLEWVNYHLSQTIYDKRVENFEDLENGQAYTYLMNQLNPIKCSLGPLEQIGVERFEGIIQNGTNIGCTTTKIVPQDISESNEQKNIEYLSEIRSLFPFMNRAINIDKEKLLEWVNIQLKNAGEEGITNFTTDIEDGAKIISLMQYLDPTKCNSEDLKDKSKDEQIQLIIQNGRKFGGSSIKSKINIIPSHLIRGNEGMVILFLQNLKKNCPTRRLTEIPKNEREECVFVNWTNSVTQDGKKFQKKSDGLAVGPIRSIKQYNTGEILLKCIDKVRPGLVDWTKIIEKPNHILKMTENCNYGIDIIKNQMQKEINPTNVGGVDFAQQKDLQMKGIIWQLMKLQQLKYLGQINENEILKWANEQVGEEFKIKKFNDKKLADCKFYFEIIKKISPETVNSQMITEGKNDDQIKNNAQYAIALARMLGSPCFVLWEQIKDIEKDFVMLFIACLKQLYHQKHKNE